MKSKAVAFDWERDLTPGQSAGPPTVAGVRQGDFDFAKVKALYDMRVDGVTYARDPLGDENMTAVIRWEPKYWGVYSRNAALHVRSLFKSADFRGALIFYTSFRRPPGKLEVHWGPL